MLQAQEFKGYSPAAPDFLMELRFNNRREWMHENHGRYETLILEPTKALVRDLGPWALETLDSAMVVSPQRVISRIYRDTRFAHDKSPLRDHMWLSFHRPRGEEEDWGLPSFYFELYPERFGYGMGLYQASPAFLALMRRDIAAHAPAFTQAFDSMAGQRYVTLAGDSYKRSRGTVAPEHQSLYDNRSPYYQHSEPISALCFSPELVERIACAFQAMLPMYGYFLNLYFRFRASCASIANQTTGLRGESDE